MFLCTGIKATYDLYSELENFKNQVMSLLHYSFLSFVTIKLTNRLNLAGGVVGGGGGGGGHV
jgi:hypothetical protein